MKGMGKFLGRTPHMVTSKIGMSKKSSDPEFEEYSRNFTTLQGATDKLYKDAKVFCDHVVELLNAGGNYSDHFATVFHPLVGEYDLIGKFPDARDTLQNVDGYTAVMQQLKEAINPELELIQTRIIAPIKDFQGVLKMIQKTITKRDHKLIDYDRFNNNLTKLREKKEKSLSDEKNLFKLEQDFEIASTDFDHLNGTLKVELPQFMVLATQFIDPLFQSFFYMQLNIFYLMKENFESFAEGKFQIGTTAAQIQQDYEDNRTGAAQDIEQFHIVKRVVSTAKMMATRESSTLAPASPSVGRSSTLSSSRSVSASSVRSSSTNSFPPPSRASTVSKKPPPPPPPSSGSSSFTAKKKPPPPPPPPSSAPPPYSPSNGTTSRSASVAAAAKRPPPPPPPLKPKPKPAPRVQYVLALYDFTAQAEGDLDFKTGDRIEVVQRTASSEDWWTGKLNGRQGVFPGNYVQEV